MSNSTPNSPATPKGTNLIELAKKIRSLELERINTEKAQEALRESEERFRLISETIHFGVFEIDTDGSCLYSNTRWQEIFGLSLVESLTVDWRERLHPDERESTSQQWKACLDNLDTFSRELKIITPKGEERWVYMHSAPVFSDAGARYTGTVEDITQRKLAEAELKRAKEEAETANRAKSQFWPI
jgi:PAS domain S-box-containing protein